MCYLQRKEEEKKFYHVITELPCRVATSSLLDIKYVQNHQKIHVFQSSVKAKQTGKHEGRGGISGEERRKDTAKEMNRQACALDRDQEKMLPHNPITVWPESNIGHRLGNLIITASL